MAFKYVKYADDEPEFINSDNSMLLLHRIDYPNGTIKELKMPYYRTMIRLFGNVRDLSLSSLDRIVCDINDSGINCHILDVLGTTCDTSSLRLKVRKIYLVFDTEGDKTMFNLLHPMDEDTNDY